MSSTCYFLPQSCCKGLLPFSPPVHPPLPAAHLSPSELLLTPQPLSGPCWAGLHSASLPSAVPCCQPICCIRLPLHREVDLLQLDCDLLVEKLCSCVSSVRHRGVSVHLYTYPSVTISRGDTQESAFLTLSPGDA